MQLTPNLVFRLRKFNRQDKCNVGGIGLIRIPGLVWDECFVSRESEAHAGEN